LHLVKEDKAAILFGNGLIQELKIHRGKIIEPQVVKVEIEKVPPQFFDKLVQQGALPAASDTGSNKGVGIGIRQIRQDSPRQARFPYILFSQSRLLGFSDFTDA
jgi:hypothetical protein